jgi:hypothetical protein
VKRERRDEVGRLIKRLRRVMPREDAPQEEWPRFDRNTILRIIEHLQRAPQSSRGNLSRKIYGRAALQEASVIFQLRARKHKYMEQGMSTVQAEWEVAEKDGPALFQEQTGRTLEPGTIRRLMQRRWRRRPTNRDYAAADE